MASAVSLGCLVYSGTAKYGLFMLPYVARIRFMLFVILFNALVTLLLLFLDISLLYHAFPIHYHRWVWSKTFCKLILEWGLINPRTTLFSSSLAKWRYGEQILGFTRKLNSLIALCMMKMFELSWKFIDSLSFFFLTIQIQVIGVYVMLCSGFCAASALIVSLVKIYVDHFPWVAKVTRDQLIASSVS